MELYMCESDPICVREYNDIKNDWFLDFQKKHKINQLMRYQEFSTIEEVTIQEKKIKWKNRAYKIQLIEENNQHWFDLVKD